MSPVVALRDAIGPLVSDDAEVLTRDEAAERQSPQFSDGGNVLLTIVLGFAAVALLVAALVIANTFQVLVAQRTRTLALLRCVGAGKGQLRRSVLLEAAILGAAASVAGLVLGLVLGQSALMVLGRLSLGVPLPSTIQVTPPVVLLPLLVGTVVTVLASLVPAREATRVSPIAALRPAEAPAVGARAGRVRLALSLLLTLGGVGVMLLAAGLSSSGRADQAIMLGIGALAGGLSFVGVLVGAVFWVPRVVSLVGARAGEHGHQRAAGGGQHRAQPPPDGRDQCGPADRRDPGRHDEHRGRERAGVPGAGARRALPGGPHGRRHGAAARREPAGRRPRGRRRGDRRRHRAGDADRSRDARRRSASRSPRPSTARRRTSCATRGPPTG